MVNDEAGKKIAVECDGDIIKTKEEYEEDIIEQDVLTRCGWKFIRIRASRYYANREKTILELISKIDSILDEDDNLDMVEPVPNKENLAEEPEDMD